MNPSRQSLRKKVLFPLLAVLVAALAFVAVEQLTGFKAHLTIRLKERGEHIASLVHFIAGSSPRTGELQRIVATLGGEPEVNLVAVLAGEPARVLASSRMVLMGKSPEEVTDPEVRNDLRAAMAVRSSTFDFDPQTEDFDYFRPLSVASSDPGGERRERGVVVVSLDSHRLRRELLATTTKAIAAYSGTALLLALSCWLLLRRQVLQPLMKIGNAVTEFQAGEVSRLLDQAHFPRELAQLADAWNGLADRLQDENAQRAKAEEALRHIHDALEVRVVERTSELALTIESLRDSEEKFRLLAENLTDSFWIRSPDMKALHYLSAGYERIWGRPIGSLQSEPHKWTEAILPEDRARVTAVYAGLMGAEPEICVEYRITRPDGAIRWVHARGFQIRDAAGNLTRLAGVVADITERKEAEILLRQKDALIRIAGRVARTGGWAVEMPEQRVFWSDEVFDLLEFPRGNVPSLAEALALYPEPWRNKITAAMEACARDGTPFDIEVQILTSKGRQIWVRVCGEAERDADGKITRVHGAFSDISDSRKATESLRLLSAAVEQSKESILITDAQLDLPGPGILFVNHAFTKMTGYTAAEVLGKTPRILQGPRSDRAVLQRLRENLTRGEVFEGETVNYRKDGTAFQLEWQIAPIRDAGGITTHFVAIQRDITERKLAEAALENAQESLRDASRQAGMAEVATSVLHNVGNVLNSVNISATMATEAMRHSCGADVTRVAGLLQEHRGDLPTFLASAQGLKLPDFLTSLGQQLGEEQQKVLGELQSLGTHIDHIKEIVEMQQTYARRAGLSEELAPESLVEDAIRLNSAAFDRHGVNVVRDFSETPLLEIDRHKALQILVNLVRNAKYAMDEPGAGGKRMTLRIRNDNFGFVQISVCDEGVGIAPENMTRIFEHGFTTRKEGHGFGLHSAALAAKEMHGSLVAQSDGLGKGAVFTLSLPLSATRTHL